MRIIQPTLLSTLTAFASLATFAQPMLEEVVVTATKRAESLQDIPVSVNALSSDTIQEAGITDLNDVAAQVPSLQVRSNLSPFATAISIRGFGTAQNDQSLEASVAFILDGVYMGNSGLGMSDLTDIERIEVLQGPQGTLYGKNSNAGVISIITQSPNLEETEGYLEASLGDYSLQRYVGSVTGPVNDAIAYRLSGSWSEQDGWLENGAGADLNDKKDWNLRAKLLWQVSDVTTAQLTASHVERDILCCGADATQSSAVLDELDRQGLDIPRNDSEDFENNVDQVSDFDLDADSVSLNIDHDFASVTLTSITAWNEYDYTTSFDGDRSELNVIHVVDDVYTGELFSQELRLTSDLDGPLQYVAGLFYSDETRTRGEPDRQTILIGDDVIPVGGSATGLGPLFAAGAQPGDYVVFNSEWKAETIALFGQATYELTSNIEATVGLRYTHEEKEASLFAEPFSTAVLYGTGQTLVEQAYSAIDTDLDDSWSGFTGLANISYFLDDGTMLFASVATGTKSGGFNGVVAEGASPNFDEEETTNYELGMKG